MRVAALFEQLPALIEVIQRPAALLPAALGHGALQPRAVLLTGGKLILQLLEVFRGAVQLVQTLLDVVHLPLERRQRALAVEAPLALPVAQLLVGLGVGGLLLTGGDDGVDALFQLRAAGDGHGALFDEGAAAEHVPADAGQQLAGVLAVHALHGDGGAGIDGGEVAHRRALGAGAAGEGDVAALGAQLHAAFHRRAGPGRIAQLVRQIAAADALGGIHAVEHGADEGAPGGFAALVGRVDHVQSVVQLQRFVFQLAEGGAQITDDHASAPPPGGRARPGPSGRPAR